MATWWVFAGGTIFGILIATIIAPALRRDQTGTGRYGRLEVTLSLFNTDVLLARNRLVYEIPAAAIRSATIVGETWPWRPIGTCLRQLPVYAHRMHNLNMATELRQLEALTRSWLRQTKRALGLRRPDIGPLADCPRCDTTPPGQLWMAGAEAHLNPHDLTAPPRWVHDPRVYCPVCGEVWPEPEWDHLARLVAVQEPALATRPCSHHLQTMVHIGHAGPTHYSHARKQAVPPCTAPATAVSTTPPSSPTRPGPPSSAHCSPSAAPGNHDA